MRDVDYLAQVVTKGCLCPGCRQRFLILVAEQEGGKLTSAEAKCPSCQSRWETFKSLFEAVGGDMTWGPSAWDDWVKAHPDYGKVDGKQGENAQIEQSVKEPEAKSLDVEAVLDGIEKDDKPVCEECGQDRDSFLNVCSVCNTIVCIDCVDEHYEKQHKKPEQKQVKLELGL